MVNIEYCPYGLNELHLSYPEDEAILQDRVETGKRLLEELHQAYDAKHKT